MSVNIAFSIMNDFKLFKNGDGYLEKGVVSSVVPFCKFEDLADVVAWMADPVRESSCDEACGIVPTTFVANDIDRSKPRYERNGSTEIDKNTFFYIDVDNSQATAKAKLEVVKAKMIKAGVSFVIYTTRRHSDQCHRFRVLFPIDAPVNRFDARKIAIYLNKIWFSGQADLKVYNPAQFLYLPKPGAQVIADLSGQPLDVRDLREKAADLFAKEPHLEIGGSKRSEEKSQKQVAETVAKCALLDSVNDMSVRPDISILNQNIFYSHWLELYQNPASHWDAMRTILGCVWKQTEGSLSYGEMRRIFDEVDATAGGYFARVHGAKKTDQLIRFFFSRPTSEANDNWKPILSVEDIGLTIDVVEAEPGQGKTFTAINEIAASGENWVIAAPKITDLDSIKKQIEERFWNKPDIYIIHSQRGRDGVQSQLTQVRKDFRRRPSKQQRIVLITHVAVMTHDWRYWSDFNLLIDEVPENFLCFPINIKNHPDILDRHIRVAKAKDGNCHKVHMRDAGKKALKANDFDDAETVNHDLLESLFTRNSTTWIEADHWKNRHQRAIAFFEMVSPTKLKAFKSVRILGDEATKSITLRTWAAKWAVKINKLEAPKRPYRIPIGKRLTIRYFSEQDDASITLFGEKQPDLLTQISAVIAAEHPDHDLLWTANERFKYKIQFQNCTHVSPRTHGRNDLQHHTVMVWLVAMKPSTAAGGAIRGVCGMSYDEVVAWREYNPMFQFVMRGSPRNPEATEDVVVYVFSRRQADYLHGRLGGRLQYVGDKLPGAPVVVSKPQPLSQKQRQQKRTWVRKMIDKGYKTWAEVPNTKTKENVDPMLIPMIETSVAEALEGEWGKDQNAA